MARPKGYPKSGGRKPGQRNRATADIRDLAQQFGPAAIRQLAKLGGLLSAGKGAAESEQARAMACNSILDRGYGKPGQAVTHSGAIGTFDLSKLSDDELTTLEPILARLALAGSGAGGNSETGG